MPSGHRVDTHVLLRDLSSSLVMGETDTNEGGDLIWRSAPFLLVTRWSHSRGGFPRTKSSREVRVIVAPTRTTKERIRCVPGEP